MTNQLHDLLSEDDLLSAGIISNVGSVELYHNPKHVTPRLFQLSLEDNSDSENMFSKLLDALIQFLIRMIDDISSGAMGISVSLNRLVNRSEALMTSSRTSRRANKSDKFKVDTRIQNLCINYKPVNDPHRILMYLKSVDALVRKYFKFQDEEMLRAIPAIMTLRPSNVGAVDQLVNILKNTCPVSFADAAGFSGDTYRKVGPHMLGNQQLVVLNKNPDGDAVEQLLGQEFILQPSDSEPKVPPQFIEYDTFASTIEQGIIRQVIGTATDLSNRIGMLARARRASRTQDLVKYLQVIHNDLTRGEYDGVNLESATQFIKLVEAYNNWLVNPYLNLLALMVRNMSAVLNVCEANH